VPFEKGSQCTNCLGGRRITFQHREPRQDAIDPFGRAKERGGMVLRVLAIASFPCELRANFRAVRLLTVVL
jgi:hypothetical protein